MSEQDSGASGFILDARSLAAKILEWRQKGYHVLSPAINMTSFAPGYAVNASFVLIDPAVDDIGRGLDVYYDKNTLKDNERGLGKNALSRIATAAGVSWLAPPASGRRDPGPGTIQNYWIYQITGVYLAYDGTPQTIHGEKEIDYRDGSAQIGGWSPAAWREALAEKKTNINGWSERRVLKTRSNGAERAETGAMERAIRMGFAIKHAYTVAELQKPFVALRVCPMMDLADPGVRAMVAERQMGGVAALFGSVASSASGPRALGPRSEPIDITPVQREPEVVSVPRLQQPTDANAKVAQPAAEPRAPEQAPSPRETPQRRASDKAQEEQLPPGAFYIKACAKEQKKYAQPRQRNGATVTHFTKWTVVNENGEEGVTLWDRWGNVAEQCFADGVPVTWQLGETNSFNEREIQNIARAEATIPL